jgi:sodium/hydrogen antiporter
MALLFTFVLFGGSLIWSGFTVLSGTTLLFAVVVLLVRPPVFLASLARSGVEWRDRLLIAWFGPRGLSSLLLVLLPVFAGLPGSDQLFSICCLVVLLSVALHGGSPIVLARTGRRQEQGVLSDLTTTPAEESLPITVTSASAVADTGDGRALTEASFLDADGTTQPAGALSQEPSQEISNTRVIVADSLRISIEELRHLWQRNIPVVLLDVRSAQNYQASTVQARSAVRMSPDRAASEAEKLGFPHAAWLVAYCA